MEMKQTPPRDYPDWHRLVPPRFCKEVYHSEDDWVFYHNVDWETFLLYTLILHHKDYLVKGGMPPWLTAYLEHGEITPFTPESNEITLCFDKKDWVENTLVFTLEDDKTEDGFVYSMQSILKPYPAFWQGKAAPGRAACPQTVWEPYVIKHMERLRYGTTWNPVI